MWTGLLCFRCEHLQPLAKTVMQQGVNYHLSLYTLFLVLIKKVKISLLQAVETPRVARGRGSHIT
jgi:hypothetical protein